MRGAKGERGVLNVSNEDCYALALAAEQRAGAIRRTTAPGEPSSAASLAHADRLVALAEQLREQARKSTDEDT